MTWLCSWLTPDHMDALTFLLFSQNSEFCSEDTFFSVSLLVAENLISVVWASPFKMTRREIICYKPVPHVKHVFVWSTFIFDTVILYALCCFEKEFTVKIASCFVKVLILKLSKKMVRKILTLNGSGEFILKKTRFLTVTWCSSLQEALKTDL